ncbi:MAG: asparagine synthase-related protein [Elusimicrobiota bacterium]
MGPNYFAGIYLFNKNRVRPAKLLRDILSREDKTKAAVPLSPAPGLALPPGSSILNSAGKSGSWLQLESPDVSAKDAAAFYQKLGSAFPSALRGQFALVMYDADNNSILLGTDRFSEIPVFYAVFSGGIAWASDPAMLSRLPGVDAGTDPRAVDLYLTMRYIPSPFTMYKGVRKLPPASVLTLRGEKISISAYWTPPMKEGRFSSFNEASEAVHSALVDATRHRLGKEKQAAAMVSGGIDSSSVSALAIHCGADVNTFTLGVEGKEWDFFGPGRTLARAIRSHHHEIYYGEPGEKDILEMSAAYGEPQADQCAFPLWKAAQQMKGVANVMFSGDGGDENFAGYGRVRQMINMAREQKAPEMELLLAKAQAAGSRLPSYMADKIRNTTDKRLKLIYSELSRIYFCDTGDFYLKQERRELCRPEFHASLGTQHETASGLIQKIIKDTAGQDWLNRLTLPDLCAFHPECTVPRLRATAARAGMRVVFPYMDHNLVELARSLPEKWKLPGLGNCKFILRKTMERHLPRQITAAKQRGFSVPAGLWIKGSLNKLFRDSMLSSDARTAHIFKRKAVEKLFLEHLTGEKDHNGRLWNLFMLELWMRTR